MSQSAPTAPSPWIVSRSWDLPLVILVPLFTAPLLWLWRWGADDFVVHSSVMAFGALGHHLPGMMRAYGDRALFHRFRTRFLLAPLFLAAVCVFFRLSGLQGLAVVAFAWGIWHGLMQTYGFARIYDAKRGSVDHLTARIDFALCLAWFVGGVVLSDTRTFQLLEFLANTGVSAPPAAAISSLRSLALAAMALSALLYVAHSIQLWRRGHAASSIKHLFLVTSLAFWWFTTNFVGSLIFGIALFEIFHDIQYLAIVWAYNRQRAKGSAAEVGAFTRLLFRGGFVGVGLYVGLVAGYGALAPLSESIGKESVRNTLAGILVASQLLHFYFDGFIWKVREGPTRATLGIDSASQKSARVLGTRGLKHLAKWGIFVLPLGALILQERSPALDQSERTLSIARALPDDASANHQCAVRLLREGYPELALEPLRRSYEMEPEKEERRTSLVGGLLEAMGARWARGDHEGAEELLVEAGALEPEMHHLLLQRADLATRAAYFADGLVYLELAGLIEGGFFRASVGLLQAECLLRMGRPRDALERVRAYKTRVSNDPYTPSLETRIVNAIRQDPNAQR